jgi:SAM-dependent methyltransferase
MTVTRAEVLCCYKAILGRNPESDAVVDRYIRTENFNVLRQIFLNSSEFKKTLKLDTTRFLMPLDLPKICIDYKVSQSSFAKSISIIKNSWTHMGNEIPHFSVLTNKNFLPDQISENVANFWHSGEMESRGIFEILNRYDFGSFDTKVCVEYGCGVGRVTSHLAVKFSEVCGMDISQPHLDIAEARVKELGLLNVKFVLCAENSLTKIPQCDFFYSRIVFQHNPPPVIYQLIKKLLEALKPNGIAIFQVPTYIVGYNFSIEEWLIKEHGMGMQMHCLPQSVICELIDTCNCNVLEIREDNSTGAPQKYLSNTFVVRKSSNMKVFAKFILTLKSLLKI